MSVFFLALNCTHRRGLEFGVWSDQKKLTLKLVGVRTGIARVAERDVGQARKATGCIVTILTGLCIIYMN